MVDASKGLKSKELGVDGPPCLAEPEDVSVSCNVV